MPRTIPEMEATDEYVIMIRVASMLQAQAEKIHRDAAKLLDKHRRLHVRQRIAAEQETADA